MPLLGASSTDDKKWTRLGVFSIVFAVSLYGIALIAMHTATWSLFSLGFFAAGIFGFVALVIGVRQLIVTGQYRYLLLILLALIICISAAYVAVGGESKPIPGSVE